MKNLSFVELLERGRQGHPEAVNVLFARYRDWLRTVAIAGFDPRLKQRIDPSDAVQQTLLEAHLDFEHFHGEHEAELTGWLRKILEHNLIDLARRELVLQKRDMSRDRSLDDRWDFGAALKDVLEADQSSPSHRAVLGEQIEQLAVTLKELPHDQALALRLRHLEGQSLDEIAKKMDRSKLAVASLMTRGMKRLREKMKRYEV